MAFVTASIHGLLVLCAAFAVAGEALADPSPVNGIVEVSHDRVQLNDGFWGPRQKTHLEVTIPHALDCLEEDGHVTNFDVAAGISDESLRGHHAFDSDLHKALEGALISLKHHDDPALRARVDDILRRILPAQQDDGFLISYYIVQNRDQRWENLRLQCQLDNAGHFFEMAVEHQRLTGDDTVLGAARRFADQIDGIFGPGKRYDVGGHEEVELALIRLYRVTGERRYLKLGQFFIDQRGNPKGHKLYTHYNQDHMPVRKQSEIVGHAVRAMYNCTGMADLYMETGDAELLAACRRLWESTTHRKMYVTGGVGATGRGEAFGKDYELPNESAYAETCAAIGLVFFAHRMWRIEPDGEYIDVLERALYNGVLGGVSLPGDEFFYVNRLASTGKGGRGAARRKWFGCACCPSNICRFIPAVPGYAYGHRGNELYVNMYLPGTAKVKMKTGEVILVQQTGYPWDGAVNIAVKGARDAEFTIKLRIPAWAQGKPVGGDLYRYAKAVGVEIGLQVNGKDVAMKIDKGYVLIGRKWKSGDTISLTLPMAVRRVEAHEKVTADTGRVALQRGPVVYCAEGKDNAGKALDIVLDDGAALKAEYRKGLLGGVSVVTGKLKGGDEFVAIPYFARANRGACEMNVWFRRTGTPSPAPAKK